MSPFRHGVLFHRENLFLTNTGQAKGTCVRIDRLCLGLQYYEILFLSQLYTNQKATSYSALHSRMGQVPPPTFKNRCMSRN